MSLIIMIINDHFAYIDSLQKFSEVFLWTL